MSVSLGRMAALRSRGKRRRILEWTDAKLLVMVLLVVATIPQAFGGGATATDTWSFISRMTVSRARHTATLLTDGMVLVAGGDGDSAELYDPNKGMWAATGSMHVARIDSTATRLENGQVLITGGLASSSHALSSAELYDPRARAWRATGSMSAGRAEATATLLPDGRVLVAGGWDNGNSLSSAELYDPRSGRWSPTAPMSTKRRYHAAALLPDGRVLVVGGVFCDPGCSVLSSAELYNPATGTWTLTAPLPRPRAYMTATTLADGRVLVAGGGTLDGADADTEAYVYDPVAGIWSATGPMVASRTRHTATLLRGGQVLVAGGETGSGEALDASDVLGTAEVYDPHANLWAATAQLAVPRAGHTATLLPTGQVLLTGGSGGGSYDNADAQVYTPGQAPLVAFATRDLAFGPQRVGTSSPARPITISNVGASLLTVSDVTVDGADPAAFSLSNGCAHIPVQPGGSCSIMVRLAPHARGYPSALLTMWPQCSWRAGGR